MATNATDATDDINSDHDIDTEHEGSLSEVMCPNGKHKWKHDQCMVCGICGECSGKHQKLRYCEEDTKFEKKTP